MTAAAQQKGHLHGRGMVILFQRNPLNQKLAISRASYHAGLPQRSDFHTKFIYMGHVTNDIIVSSKMFQDRIRKKEPDSL